MTFLISKNSRQITGHYSLINATSNRGAPQSSVHATTTWGHGGCSTGCGLAFSMKMHNPHAWIGAWSAWTTPWKHAHHLKIRSQKSLLDFPMPNMTRLRDYKQNLPICFYLFRTRSNRIEAFEVIDVSFVSTFNIWVSQKPTEKAQS